MVNQNDDQRPIGWPFGLGFLNTRFRAVESIPATSAGPYSLHVPSTSFSSFSSSNLDTESTASFFQDNSVSLGRLIGIRPSDRGRGGHLYSPNTNPNSHSNSVKFEERERKTLAKGSCSDVSKVEQRVDMSRRICLPLLLDVVLKINKNKKSSKH